MRHSNDIATLLWLLLVAIIFLGAVVWDSQTEKNRNTQMLHSLRGEDLPSLPTKEKDNGTATR